MNAEVIYFPREWKGDMTKTFCDKCNHEIISGAPTFKVLITRNQSDSASRVLKEICTTCADNLLRPFPQEAPSKFPIERKD